MRIFNTLSGQKEELPRPEKGGKKPLRLFVCGPTVYNFLHIGNARVSIFFDTFVRYLRTQRKKIFYLQNITDIDDKIIARAQEEHLTPKKLAEKYTRAFKKNMHDLRIASVTKYASATRFIPEIIAQVRRLIKKGHAYKIDDDGWYFDLSTFPDYGKLAKRTAEQAEDGVSRIDASYEKRNRGDFCLWKFSKPGSASSRIGGEPHSEVGREPVWKAPFGNGRPGWHIEDTAISEKFFGPQYDIHGAGRDLIFPHHEAEIAQQESASGKKPFVKIWMHVGLVTMNGKKMAKSFGNFITIDDFLSRHNANVLRLISLQGHYRAPMDFTDKVTMDATLTLKGLEEFFAKLQLATATRTRNIKLKTFNLKTYNAAFYSAMEDDVNTPKAIATIFTMVNAAQNDIWNLSPTATKNIKKWLIEALAIFGIVLVPLKIPAKIKTLAAKRELFRSHQQFASADALRKELSTLGYKVEDTPRGPLVFSSKI